MTMTMKTINTSSGISLNPCPSCGSQAKISSSTVDDYVLIACEQKGCKIVSAKTIPEAAELWNKETSRD